ncbi:carboxypeptidase-like regulatory domain-containing protein [bacterium]|nr:carboxypeptidase-like regulatory domain-containing protein [bacterium]
MGRNLMFRLKVASTPAVVLLGLCLLCSSCSTSAALPTGSVSRATLPAHGAEPVFAPNRDASLPPLPLDLGGRNKSASALQNFIQTGNQALDRSAGAVDNGTKITLTAGPGEMQWAMYEFTPPTDLVYSALFTMVPKAGTGSYIAIGNYASQRWDFKGPYPATPGFAAFASLNNGDFISPSGHIYLLVLAWNNTTTELTQVQVSGDDGQAPTYDISGKVVRAENNQPLAGVTLTMLPGGATAFSDNDGNFSFTGLQAASYRITPSAPGYDFNPPLQDVLLTNADVSGIDFLAFEEVPGFSISGTVSLEGGGPLAGVSVSISPGSLVATTDSNGNYLFAGQLAGNYTLTPSLSGHTFAPTQQSVPLFGSDALGVNFTATEESGPPWTVSGTVTDNQGQPLAGVNIFVPFTNRITVTDAQGKYSIANLDSDPNFHILPSLDDHSFVPNINKLNLDSNKVLDFVGTPQTLPNTVTYAQHMVPWVLQPMCTPCHDSNLNSDDERHGAPLGIDFDTYNGTSTNEKKDSDDEAQADRMPDPDAWGSLKLTAFQKELFARWREQNFPQ